MRTKKTPKFKAIRLASWRALRPAPQAETDRHSSYYTVDDDEEEEQRYGLVQ